MRFETAVPLGRGACGEVFRVHDAALGRDVAVKVLASDDPILVERIGREARLQARVRHPNVAEVYEVGSWEGRPYIAMQLVDGPTLDIAARDLPLEARLRLAAGVARAVHAAHAVGLIHRDLKPGNVLVESREGGLEPVVVDFGIARENASRGHTVTGEMLGTPGYMSPEQARGETTRLDRRSDVFSLGALLYELVSDSDHLFSASGGRPRRSGTTPFVPPAEHLIPVPGPSAPVAGIRHRQPGCRRRGREAAMIRHTSVNRD